jgi:hypothetical protein
MMRLVATFLLAILCGCSIFRSNFDPFASGADRRLSVSVLNEHFSTVTVTALAPGLRTLVGRADGNARTGFSIPWSGEGEVRFLLETLGGQRYTTATLLVGPGGRLNINVRDPLQQSTVRR